MEQQSTYPRLEINLKKLESNVKEIVKRCGEKNIDVVGVIKGASGILECAKTVAKAGCEILASPRIEQIEAAREAEIDTKFMMLRSPMLSEIKEVIRLADISVNSEPAVLRALNEEAIKQNKIHEVMLMADLGDLREGIWDEKELIDVALEIENNLKSLKLNGLGTNLGCYGSIAPTASKLEKLVELAEEIEKNIGRKLDYISGGATTSLARIFDNDMPARINQLRIGEGFLLARDLDELWGYDVSFLHKDVFTLKAEVIEVKDKPSHPVGEIMFDAFGNRPTYIDKGIRKKALLGIGKVDYAYYDKILPKLKGVEVLGGSSDHTILDIEEAEKEIRVGDIIEFDLSYAALPFLSSSKNVKIRITND